MNNMIVGLDKTQAGKRINHKGLWCNLTGYYHLERVKHRIVQYWQIEGIQGWIKHTIKPIKPSHERVITM